MNSARSQEGGVAPGRSAVSRTPTGYLMVLRGGDDVFAELGQFAQREQVAGATFTGIGFVQARLGFFDPATREYRPRDFPPMELASFSGSLAWKDGQPSVHAHAVLGDGYFQTHGGHLLAATVGNGSLEIALVVSDRRLERARDESTGADVLGFGPPGEVTAPPRARSAQARNTTDRHRKTSGSASRALVVY